jgi:hypothetical protein
MLPVSNIDIFNTSDIWYTCRILPEIILVEYRLKQILVRESTLEEYWHTLHLF